MKKRRLFFQLLAITLFLPGILRAEQEPFEFPGSSYKISIARPEVFLGYKLGIRFTPHHKVLGYLRAISQSSARVELYVYGKTYEGRELAYVVVSSESNMRRIDELRGNNLLLADPKTEISDEFLENAPIFVWLSYNVHGNEASATETALALVYHLAADESKETSELLDKAVVIIDPVLNPDGRERYVEFITSRLGSEPDENGDSWEHHEPWPGGRFNHYLFDLNRDWSWLSQTESRQRVKAYLSWMPEVHVDFHEMYSSSSYFFFPPSKPVNPNYPDFIVSKWDTIFGNANAKAFDERGWTYFSGELFDLFYPGYGDSWPTYHGATGMTYEQAGHSKAGLLLKRPDGKILTLAERMMHHFVSSLATVDASIRHRVERLEDFRKFFEEGIHGARKEKVKEYIIPNGIDPAGTAELVGLLLEHGIEVDVATGPVSCSSIGDAWGHGVKRKNFPEGTYIVPMKQPLRRFAKTLLETNAELPDTSFYDITAWSLPLAYGTDVFHAYSLSKGPRRALREKPRAAGKIRGDDPIYGYLVPWDNNGSPKVLSALLKNGCYVKFAGEDFTLNGRNFGSGTLIIPRAMNPDTLRSMIERFAGSYGVDIYGAKTSLTEKGMDLGSNKARYIKPARVALVCGDGTNPTSVGAVWFLLDRIYHVDHSVIDIKDLKTMDLSKYKVIVFPDASIKDGRRNPYSEHIDSTMVSSLKQWIAKGGVYVGLGQGAVFATQDYSKLSSVKLKKEEKKKEKEKPRDNLLTVKEKKERRKREKIPGAIFRVVLDKGHPLSFGYKGDIMVLKTSERAFEADKKVNNVGYFPEHARVAGYVSKKKEEFLSLTPYLVEEKLGKGHIVLYLDDPNFRLFWYGLNRLFLNAVFFVPNV